MPKISLRWQGLLGLIAVMVLAAGCFQQASTNVQLTQSAPPVGLQPTFTPALPTDTPPPPATNTPQPSAVQQVVVPSDTPPAAGQGVFAVPSPTQAAVNPLVAIVPSAMPVSGNVGGPAVALQPSQGAAQVDSSALLSQQQAPLAQQIDPLQLTATAIIGGATQTAVFNITETAVAAGLANAPVQQPFATATPNLFVLPTATVNIFLTPTARQGETCIHVVQAGDRNLYRISLRYGVTYQEIAQASGIANPALISIGQSLTIPGLSPSTGTPQPCPGSATPSGNVPSQPTGTCQGYLVRQGDTLFGISRSYGPTVHEIAAANGISNIDVIYINQCLVIP